MPKKLTTEQFIKKAKEAHGDTYDYNSVIYISIKTKVAIDCSTHGKFYQTPEKHLKGQGCSKCSRKHKKTTEEFVEEAKKVHGNKYDYSKAFYTRNRDKIKIICKKHGQFFQNPINHLLGYGCDECGREITTKYSKNNPTGWSYTNWKKAGERSKNFDSFKVYIIKCWNENEEFYKIGKTFTTIEKRFKNKTYMPYNWKKVQVFKGGAKEMSILEKKLQKNNKKHKYTPKNNFKGVNECYNLITQ